nr:MULTISPECIES: YheC/YheD family protein [unclassified Paenibacillus]
MRFHRMLRKVPQIRAYLPHTAFCNERRLAEFLNRYPAVFIKPDGGERGIGVIKAWKEGSSISYIKVKGDPQTVGSVRELIQKLKLQRPHIVQQAIDLAKIDGRPFDIRLMMMRNRSKRWTYIGMVAKVAGSKSVVTNVARSNGYVSPIDRALRLSLGLTGTRAEQKKREMIRLAERCNRVYSKTRYGWQLGYDLAIDNTGKVWFIELNPSPAHSLFRKEPSAFRTIKRLAAVRRI